MSDCEGDGAGVADSAPAGCAIPASAVVAALAGRKVAIFDLEIKANPEAISGGWGNHAGMGVSVLCVFDYESMRYRLFDDASRGEALDLLYSREVVAGFNTVNFDWRVLDACWGVARGPGGGALARPLDADLLAAIYAGLGGRSKGYKLDDVLADTLGVRKSGDGAAAPGLWQSGRHAALHDYVLCDVTRERQLFEYALTHGCVRRAGRKVPIRWSAGVAQRLGLADDCSGCHRG